MVVHCKTLRGLFTSKLSSLATLDLSGNEDLEDNVDISAIAEILESCAGRLILEDLDDDDDGAQEEQEPETQKVAVDELTDLIESQLTLAVSYGSALADPTDSFLSSTARYQLITIPGNMVIGR
jgi:hypothetical protein